MEWISDWANVDFGEAFDDYYFGKSPLQDPELYLRKSPIFKMDRVKTPTLIFFGTIDRQVPTEEGWTHYRTLYSLGKVPVRFLLFPGEPHGPRKLSHQMPKVTEEMAWFDKYISMRIRRRMRRSRKIRRWLCIAPPIRGQDRNDLWRGVDCREDDFEHSGAAYGNS